MSKYIKPESVANEFVIEDVIASSFNTPVDGKDDVVAGSNEGRGEWGNLWKK